MNNYTESKLSNTLVRGFWLFLSVFTSAPIAIGYGVLLRAIMGGGLFGYTLPADIRDVLGTLTAAFMLLGPFAIGVLTVAFAPSEWRQSIVYALVMSLINCTLWVLVVLILNLEVAICLAMALPIILPLAILGGLSMWVVFRVWHGLRGQLSAVAVFVLLPYLIAPIESRLPIEDSFHTVETVLVIKADPQTIWQTMIRVPAIQPSERDFRLFHALGMPWPVEAVLDRDGLGGVRFAKYEGGLQLQEPITAWQPNQTFSFDIVVVEPERLPPPYNGLGGPAFAPLNATFILEPLGPGQTRVRLISQHRLTTRFNAYGGLWTEFFMADIQNHILHVIQVRAEAGP